MRWFRVVLLCSALIGSSAPVHAENEDPPEGCAAEPNCVPPVYVDPEREAQDGAPERPAIHCQGQNCLPPDDNPVLECEGQDCTPAPAPDQGGG